MLGNIDSLVIIKHIWKYWTIHCYELYLEVLANSYKVRNFDICLINILSSFDYSSFKIFACRSMILIIRIKNDIKTPLKNCLLICSYLWSISFVYSKQHKILIHYINNRNKYDMKATKIFGSFVVGLLLKELLSCKFVFEIYVCLTSAVTLTLRTFTCSALCGYPVHNLT